MKTPNASTQRAMQDIRLRRNLTRAKDTSEMFQQLGIQLDKTTHRVIATLSKAKGKQSSPDS